MAKNKSGFSLMGPLIGLALGAAVFFGGAYLGLW